MELTMDSTDWLVCRMVWWERSSRDNTFCSFSPSAFRIWARAACCRATDSNRSETAWLRRCGAAVVVVVVEVVDVVVVVLVVVVEVVVLLVLLVVVVVLVVVVEVVVVLVVVVEVVVVVLVVGKRQTVGSGKTPTDRKSVV